MSNDDNFNPDAVKRKILPRNLTARAAYEPRGNPSGSRPESGPDNCYPGLDFDARNLESGFFPGLRFEFHLGDDGIRVVEVATTGPAAERGITPKHLPLFLWAVMGRTETSQGDDDVPFFSMAPLDASDGWSRIHDLMPGRVAILLGPLPPRIPGVPENGDDAMRAALKTGEGVLTATDGKLEWAVLVADRAAYLDQDGVIDPNVYRPGELTRTLCAPWQLDFKDCVCTFWAANKPDLVTHASGKQLFSYYSRAIREDLAPDVLNENDRKSLESAPLIGGAWNTHLPVVLNDQEEESGIATPAPAHRGRARLGRDEFVKELRYLATVEHALSVQYLYAHYSLKAPIALPLGPVPDETQHIFAAAREIFEIAVDEMRHLRWANEALILLGARVEVGRATVIGPQTFKHEFELVPLTPEQLQWFIDVEKPSRTAGSDDELPAPREAGIGQTQNVDGMYVRLLASIDELPEPFTEHARLKQIIKLIIDEGEDHYRRFLAVQAHLKGLDPKEYLQLGPVDPEGAKKKGLTALVEESNTAYDNLLTTLHRTLSEDDASGIPLEQARRTMRNLHEINHALASRQVGPPFDLPGWAQRPPKKE